MYLLERLSTLAGLLLQSEQDQNQIESEIDQLKEAGPRLEVDGLTQIQDMQEAADKVDEECIRTREKVWFKGAIKF